MQLKHRQIIQKSNRKPFTLTHITYFRLLPKERIHKKKIIKNSTRKKYPSTFVTCADIYIYLLNFCFGRSKNFAVNKTEQMIVRNLFEYKRMHIKYLHIFKKRRRYQKTMTMHWTIFQIKTKWKKKQIACACQCTFERTVET